MEAQKSTSSGSDLPTRDCFSVSVITRISVLISECATPDVRFLDQEWSHGFTALAGTFLVLERHIQPIVKVERSEAFVSRLVTC